MYSSCLQPGVRKTRGGFGFVKDSRILSFELKWRVPDPAAASFVILGPMQVVFSRIQARKEEYKDEIQRILMELENESSHWQTTERVANLEL